MGKEQDKHDYGTPSMIDANKILKWMDREIDISFNKWLKHPSGSTIARDHLVASETLREARIRIHREIKKQAKKQTSCKRK